MNTDLVVVMAVAGVVVAVAGVVVSAIAILAGLRGVRDQLQTATFLACTDRYANVMAQLPLDARRPGSGYRLHAVSEEERTRLLKAFREYFSLCSEERWLHSRGRIDEDTWTIWMNGMEGVGRFPCFDEAWRTLSSEYEYFGAFRAFMQGLASKATVRASD